MTDSDKDLFGRWLAATNPNVRGVCDFVKKGEVRHGVLVEAIRYLLNPDHAEFLLSYPVIWDWTSVPDALVVAAGEIIVEMYAGRKVPRAYIGHVLALIGRVPDGLANRLFAVLDLDDIGETEGDENGSSSGPLPVFGLIQLHDGVPTRLKDAADRVVKEMIRKEIEAATKPCFDRLHALQTYLRVMDLTAQRQVDGTLFASQVAFLVGVGKKIPGRYFGTWSFGRILDRIPFPSIRADFVEFVVLYNDASLDAGSPEAFRDIERMWNVSGLPPVAAQRLHTLLTEHRERIEEAIASQSARAANIAEIERRMR